MVWVISFVHNIDLSFSVALVFCTYWDIKIVLQNVYDIGQVRIYKHAWLGKIGVWVKVWGGFIVLWWPGWCLGWCSKCEFVHAHQHKCFIYAQGKAGKSPTSSCENTALNLIRRNNLYIIIVIIQNNYFREMRMFSKRYWVHIIKRLLFIWCNDFIMFHLNGMMRHAQVWPRHSLLWWKVSCWILQLQRWQHCSLTTFNPQQ